MCACVWVCMNFWCTIKVITTHRNKLNQKIKPINEYFAYYNWEWPHTITIITEKMNWFIGKKILYKTDRYVCQFKTQIHEISSFSFMNETKNENQTIFEGLILHVHVSHGWLLLFTKWLQINEIHLMSTRVISNSLFLYDFEQIYNS